MAVYPPGVLSFLYNLVHNSEVTKEFRNDPTEVLDYFRVPAQYYRPIHNIGEAVRKVKAARMQQVASKTTTQQPIQLPVSKNDVEPYVPDKNERDRLLEGLRNTVKKELELGYGRFW